MRPEEGPEPRRAVVSAGLRAEARLSAWEERRPKIGQESATGWAPWPIKRGECPGLFLLKTHTQVYVQEGRHLGCLRRRLGAPIAPHGSPQDWVSCSLKERTLEAPDRPILESQFYSLLVLPF